MVLVHPAGMDAAALHVATTRHREQVLIFTARGPDLHAPDLHAPDRREPGHPPSQGSERPDPAVIALAEQARDSARSPDDIPVYDDLARTQAHPAERAASEPVDDTQAGRPGTPTRQEPDQIADRPRDDRIERTDTAREAPGIDSPRAPELAERRTDGNAELPEAMARLELNDLAEKLKRAWTEQAQTAREVARTEQQLAAAREHLAKVTSDAQRLAESGARLETARAAAEAAKLAAEPAAARITERTTELREQIHTAWAREYEPARAAAADYLAGPGRFGFGQARVNRGEDRLQHWAAQWRHLHPRLDTTDTTALARQANMHPDNHRHTIRQAFEARVGEQVRTELPDQLAAVAHGRTTAEHAETVAGAHRQLETHVRMRATYGPAIARLDRDPARAVQQATTAHQNAVGAHRTATAGVAQLRAAPVLQAQPEPEAWVLGVRGVWSQAITAARNAARAADRAARAAEHAIDDSWHHHTGPTTTTVTATDPAWACEPGRPVRTVDDVAQPPPECLSLLPEHSVVAFYVRLKRSRHPSGATVRCSAGSPGRRRRRSATALRRRGGTRCPGPGSAAWPWPGRGGRVPWSACRPGRARTAGDRRGSAT